jgi:hypothetical protein
VEEQPRDGSYELTRKIWGRVIECREPTMTRGRSPSPTHCAEALLFWRRPGVARLGGTLDADRAPFVERWYPNTGGVKEGASLEEETRPGYRTRLPRTLLRGAL